MSEEKKDQKKVRYNPNLTEEEKRDLGDKSGNLRSDGGDDEELKHRTRPVDFEGKDLDVPGRTLPEDRDRKDLKDEENQLYSEDDSE